MSKPKPGLGKGLVRTLAQGAHPHSTKSGPSAALAALQLAPVVSQHAHSYATTTRESPPPFPLPTQTGSSALKGTTSATWSLPAALSGLIIQPSPYLALLPTWDPPPSSDLAFRPDSSSSVQPYRLSTPLKTFRSPTPAHIRKASYITASVPASMFNSSFLGPLPSGPSLPPSLLVSPFNVSLPTHQPGSAVFDLAPPPPVPPSPKPQRADESHHTVLSPTPLSASDAPSSSNVISHPHLAFPDLGRPVNLSTPTESEGSTALNLYSSNLIFDLGASGLAKERTPPPPPRRDRSSTPPPRPRTFPLPDIAPPTTLHSIGVGEDAYFARLDGMCIADGVGGWARSGRGGADAGRWSRLLTHFCEVEVGQWWAGAEGYLDEAALEERGMSGWARRSWTKHRGEDSMEGLEGGRKRKPLDPVEIMQKGYEKCLACVLAEVGFSPGDFGLTDADLGYTRLVHLPSSVAPPLHTAYRQPWRLLPPDHSFWRGRLSDERDAARLQLSVASRYA